MAKIKGSGCAKRFTKYNFIKNCGRKDNTPRNDTHCRYLLLRGTEMIGVKCRKTNV